MFLEIAQKVEKGKKLDHITRDDKITSFGIDSVSMMEIIGFFEDELNIKIPDEKLALIQTVGDIENVIKSQHKSQHRSQQPEQLL
jgi:acyl carrier protein